MSSRVNFKLLPVILLLMFNFAIIEGAGQFFRTFFVSIEVLLET